MRHKSAVKASRQQNKRAAHNHSIKARCRTEVRKLEKFLGEGAKAGAEQIQGQFNSVQSLLMRAVRKNILKKNTAARTISRLHSALSRAAS